MKIKQRTNSLQKSTINGTSIMIVKESTVSIDVRNQTPYCVLGIWALEGIVIAQQKTQDQESVLV